jgi:hypothetical protein
MEPSILATLPRSIQEEDVRQRRCSRPSPSTSTVIPGLNAPHLVFDDAKGHKLLHGLGNTMILGFFLFLLR